MANQPRSNGDQRPDPESLLDRYQLRDLPPEGAAEGSSDSSGPARRKRGRLRIYLGMAAGVGKTYAMLNEGRRRKSRGTDVVVAWVDTHHRLLTEQQIGDLEIIPRKRIEYRGVTLEEMDLDAVLARKPTVALVDELAHSNVPGSRHEKRYQDVEALLMAGITVITTVNIQHLEGVNEVVEAVTSVRQRETLPDRILDAADEVEMVDISPEALRARLRHGNVYPAERAQQALERYFTISNLTALRELALQRVSELTQRQLDALMRGEQASGASLRAQAVSDCVLVAFDARPVARRLFHEGWRLAHALRAPLLAAHIETSASPVDGTLSPPLGDYVRLAEDLGAEVIQMQSDDVAEALAKIAGERHVTLLIVGAPPAPRGGRGTPTAGGACRAARLAAHTLLGRRAAVAHESGRQHPRHPKSACGISAPAASDESRVSIAARYVYQIA